MTHTTHMTRILYVYTQAFGHVRDVVTGEAIEGAALRTTAFEWNYDEAVATNAFGRYHLWVPTGTWQVNVTAPGYADIVIDVEVCADQTVSFFRCVFV
jgi:hypothetical protein